MERTQLDILLEKYRKGVLTDADRSLLSGLLLTPEHQQELEFLIDKGFTDAELRELGDMETRELIYQQISLQREMSEGSTAGIIRQDEPLNEVSVEGMARIIKPDGLRRKWWLGAAAVIFILLGVGIYRLSLKDGQKQAVTVQTQEERFKNEVPPGGNKAILTLGNGSTIVLDTTRNGAIALQGGMQVVKLADGQLLYKGTGGAKSAGSGGTQHPDIVYNRVSTPRGGEYKLGLPDGTMIWLNSGSSIRYPTSFTGSERKVEISGEAYFEVAKDAAKPFKVKIISAKGDGGEVLVLGTHFNISAYDDESGIRTTLLQGSVKVLAGGKGLLLMPGQQADVMIPKGESGMSAAGGTDGPIWMGVTAGPIRLIKDADAEEAVAWVKGIFKFKQVTIGPLMRAIARWYDVDVDYEGKINSHFIVTIPRNLPVTDVFKILEQTGEVHFKIDGKKVTVMP